MNIKKSRLKAIIKEEIDSAVDEGRGMFGKMFNRPNKDIAGEMEALKAVYEKFEGDHGLEAQVAYDYIERALKRSGPDIFKADDAPKAQLRDLRSIRQDLTRMKNRFQRAAEKEAASYRSPVMMKHEREEEERRRRWAREKEEEEARGPAYGSGSSKKGSAYDKFGKRYGDGDSYDMTRLEETIAKAMKEILKGK